MTLTKFQAIALPLVERGFWVTPVRPDAKAGATGNWQWWQYRTREQVLNDYVEKYAACNGGVVGMRGVGNLCFLDNDGGIPRDIIERLPRTYSVKTRPDSSHQHFYFRQKEFSVAKFGPEARTINVRDTTQIVESPSGGLMYKTLFDMKGIGGASFVVAPGSTKPNGDPYTCVDDGEVADIPDWLVDWVLEQQRNYHLALNRIARRNFKEKRRAAKIDPSVREQLRAEGHPDGFDIFPLDRRNFVLSRAFKLARLGITGEPLVNLLVSDIRRYVEGGVAYCQTERALASIQGIAHQAEEQTEQGRPGMDFYQKKGKLWVSEGTHIYGEIPTPPRQDVLRGIIHDFPDRITCEEADKRLTDGMNLVGVPPYDKRKDRTTVYEIRKEEGLDVGRKFWTRAATVTPPSSSHITAKVTPVSPGPRRSK